MQERQLEDGSGEFKPKITVAQPIEGDLRVVHVEGVGEVNMLLPWREYIQKTQNGSYASSPETDVQALRFEGPQNNIPSNIFVGEN